MGGDISSLFKKSNKSSHGDNFNFLEETKGERELQIRIMDDQEREYNIMDLTTEKNAGRSQNEADGS